MRSVVQVDDNRIVMRRIFAILVSALLFTAGLATVFGSSSTAQSAEPSSANSSSAQPECPEPSPSPSPSAAQASCRRSTRTTGELVDTSSDDDAL